MSDLTTLLFNGLKASEGFRGDIYDDKTGRTLHPGDTLIGNATTGYGFAFSKNPMSEKQATSILLDKCMETETWCSNNLKYWSQLSPFRQYAVANIVYQIGGEGWLGFKLANHYLSTNDYESASIEIIHSDLCIETPERTKRMATIIQSDNMPYA